MRSEAHVDQLWRDTCRLLSEKQRQERRSRDRAQLALRSMKTNSPRVRQEISDIFLVHCKRDVRPERKDNCIVAFRRRDGFLFLFLFLFRRKTAGSKARTMVVGMGGGQQHIGHV